MLWDAVVRQIKPLERRRAAKTQTTPPPELPVAKHPTSARPIVLALAPRAAKPAVPPLAQFGRRERTRLSRGRSEIEARLSRDSRLDQRKLRALLVQGVDGMVDRTIERISVGEGLVCEMV